MVRPPMRPAVIWTGAVAGAMMAAAAAGATERSAAATKSYLAMYLDNDLFGGSDADYTNGFRAAWISGALDFAAVGPFQRWLRPFSGDRESLPLFQAVTGFRDLDRVDYHYGVSLTQLMFTPETWWVYGQPPGERRYAGWLGLGLSLHAKDDSVLNAVEFTLGVVGKDSLAEPSQDVIHDLLGSPHFNGWDCQVPSELTIDLSLVQKRRLEFLTLGEGAWRLDAVGEWGLRLGTFRTKAHLGGMLRFGYNLPPDFSDPRLSDTAYSHRYFTGDADYLGPWSAYLLCGATMRLIAHDATLDGPLFESDFRTGNHREPLVGELFAGFGVRYREVELGYAHTLRSEEYEEQDHWQDFGTVALRVRF